MLQPYEKKGGDKAASFRPWRVFAHTFCTVPLVGLVDLSMSPAYGGVSRTKDLEVSNRKQRPYASDVRLTDGAGAARESDLAVIGVLLVGKA